MFKSTLEAAQSSGDIPELTFTQGIDKYADFIVTAVSTAVDKPFRHPNAGALRVNLFWIKHLCYLRRNEALGGSTLKHMTIW